MAEGSNIKATDLITPDLAGRIIDWIDAECAPVAPVERGETIDVYRLNDLTVVWVGGERD